LWLRSPATVEVARRIGHHRTWLEQRVAGAVAGGREDDRDAAARVDAEHQVAG